MRVINCNDVNEALLKGLSLLTSEGVEIPSRNGPTLEMDTPVATVYENPRNRVMISKVRDANPFFHFMESMWVLAGCGDVAFLTEFNKRMADYSDDGKVFNAPYGQRLMSGFGIDQIESIINTLIRDPNSRQAVGQIWDVADLERATKDKACNMQVVFRMRSGRLDLTVYNRSNDVIWGAYGANVVQFSTLLEYVAAKVGVPMGTYTQVSNSYHIYLDGPGGDLYNKLLTGYPDINNCNDVTLSQFNQVTMSAEDMPAFERDLSVFFSVYDSHGLTVLGDTVCWESAYFNKLVMPMLCTFIIHKAHGASEALHYVNAIKSSDWYIACFHWLENRIK